jgi:hypothetical protein
MTDDDMITQWITDLEIWLAERYDEDDEDYEQFERCFKRLLLEDVTDLKA